MPACTTPGWAAQARETLTALRSVPRSTTVRMTSGYGNTVTGTAGQYIAVLVAALAETDPVKCEQNARFYTIESLYFLGTSARGHTPPPVPAPANTLPAPSTTPVPTPADPYAMDLSDYEGPKWYKDPVILAGLALLVAAGGGAAYALTHPPKRRGYAYG